MRNEKKRERELPPYDSGFGKIEVALNLRTGEPYDADDWRALYLHRPGIYVILDLTKPDDGGPRRGLFFFPDDADSNTQHYLQSTAGDVVPGQHGFDLVTKNSVYCVEHCDAEEIGFESRRELAVQVMALLDVYTQAWRLANAGKAEEPED